MQMCQLLSTILWWRLSSWTSSMSASPGCPLRTTTPPSSPMSSSTVWWKGHLAPALSPTITPSLYLFLSHHWMRKGEALADREHMLGECQWWCHSLSAPTSDSVSGQRTGLGRDLPQERTTTSKPVIRVNNFILTIIMSHSDKANNITSPSY